MTVNPGCDRARGVLVNPASSYCALRMNNLAMAVLALGLHFHVVELRHADELDSAFAAMTRAGADAIIVIEDALLLSGRRGRTVDLAAKHRLRAMYDWRQVVATGGRVSYGSSLLDTRQRVATYVDKILKGAKPATLPVEWPTTFKSIINLKAARALGLTIPPALLQADKVIQ
jgi:putative tryptophan/tyrosine transport system substrate-binding protein